MKNKIGSLFLSLTISFLFWLVPFHANGKQSGFAYFPEKAKISSLLLDPENGEILIQDRAQSARFSSDQSFFAFESESESESLSIAIPKKMDAKQWTYAGNSYRIVGKFKMRWRGRLLDVYRITMRASDAKIFAIYNVRFGVIGFEFFDGALKSRIYVRARCGYAAHDC